MTIDDILEESRKIVLLADDWDGEGAKGYTELAWERMRACIECLYEDTHTPPTILPRIDPGPDGSFDLLWREPNLMLLINVSADAGEASSYYGDHRNGQNAIKGIIQSLDDVRRISQWLGLF